MKQKRLARILSLVLVLAFLPTFALADTWYLEDGNITIEATADSEGNTFQQVTQGETSKPDSAPVISNRESSVSTTNTVTIKAEENATANVTLDGVNSNPTGDNYHHEWEQGDAAIKTEGAGDVNLNIEGRNTAKSGSGHAGLEKNNTGSLTIDSESGSGQLTARGGDGGAGIGGGSGRSGDNITIAGGTINASGVQGGAGIGGGDSGSGSNITISGGKVEADGMADDGSGGGTGIGGGAQGRCGDITISGGEVIAKGGKWAAGIGGGLDKGSGNVIISDSKVSAIGGIAAAGIGGGPGGGISGVVSISGNAEVKAAAGGRDGVFNTGAAIGSGGSGYGNGTEADLDTSGLYTTGSVGLYNPGSNLNGEPHTTIRGTVPSPDAPVTPTEPGTSDSGIQAKAPVAAYWVTDLEGNWIAFTETRQDGKLTLTVDADAAVLNGTVYGLSALENAGITEITLKTAKQEASFSLNEVITQSAISETYVPGESGTYRLTLDGSTVSFTLDGQQRDTLVK